VSCVADFGITHHEKVNQGTSQLRDGRELTVRCGTEERQALEQLCRYLSYGCLTQSDVRARL